MLQDNSSLLSGRRHFIRKLLGSGALACWGCNDIFSQTAPGKKQQASEEDHKFFKDSGMSFQEVFAFAYKIYMIPLLERMADKLGRDKFIEQLKAAATEVDLVVQTRDMWRGLLTGVFWNHVLTREIIEESDTVLKYKVRECLWAKTFRESSAGDIGYALFCYPDFARARVAHRKLTRTTTLMQGGDCCDFYFELEEPPQG